VIVHNAETIEQALQMLASSPEGVRYSDQYAYVIIMALETLEYQCQRALARNDIAVVVPRGHEDEMEVHSSELLRIRKRRREEEKKQIKEWMREHPEIAKASAEDVPKIVRQLRKGEVK